MRLFFRKRYFKKIAPKDKINLVSIVQELKKKKKETAIFQKISQIEKQLISNWGKGDIFLFLSQGNLKNLPTKVAKIVDKKYQNLKV